MPRSPLDDPCDAIRALRPVKAQQAFAELCQTNAISLGDAIEYTRALTALRRMVDKRTKHFPSGNRDRARFAGNRLADRLVEKISKREGARWHSYRNP